MKMKKQTILRIVIPLLVALFSMLVLSKTMSSPETYKKTLASLNEKKETVTTLAAAATTASAIISMTPDDAATPLANEIADLSSWFLIILSAIYIEKYLLTVIGLIVFRFVIPIVCVLYILHQWTKSESYKKIMQKLMVISLIGICVIPASETVSRMINETHRESIAATMELANQELDMENDDKEGLSAFISKITDGATEILEWAKSTLSNFIDAVAVMVVTSCVIPIFVLFFLIWFVKYMLGLNINFSKVEFGFLKKIKVKKSEELLEDKE